MTKETKSGGERKREVERGTRKSISRDSEGYSEGNLI